MLDVADSLELATDHIDEGKIVTMPRNRTHARRGRGGWMDGCVCEMGCEQGTNEELKQIYNGVKLTEAQMHKAFDNFDIEKYTPVRQRRPYGMNMRVCVCVCADG